MVVHKSCEVSSSCTFYTTHNIQLPCMFSNAPPPPKKKNPLQIYGCWDLRQPGYTFSVVVSQEIIIKESTAASELLFIYITDSYISVFCNIVHLHVFCRLPIVYVDQFCEEDAPQNYKSVFHSDTAGVCGALYPVNGGRYETRYL